MTYDTINNAQTVAGNGEGTFLAGRYRVVRQLGAGGMGSVWLAEDTQLDNKPFAIKMLPSILVSNKRAYRQLKDEALVAMKLTHPNIVQIRAFEENNGNPFLVMDYIDGQTLDDYLAEHSPADATPADAAPADVARPPRPCCKGEGALATSPGTTGVPPVALGLAEADVIRILKPIAAALDYAHGEGVVHRDVKPANVMIRKDGHPFILDFGIAREIQETMTRVTGKLSSGTLLYMSPEQLHGVQPRKEQDIYSFSAMVYECLRGEPPFSRGQIEYQIDNDTPFPLPDGVGISKSVMAGLLKKPERRPPSCADVLMVVRECSVVPKEEPLPPEQETTDANRHGVDKRQAPLECFAIKPNHECVAKDLNPMARGISLIKLSGVVIMASMVGVVAFVATHVATFGATIWLFKTLFGVGLFDVGGIVSLLLGLFSFYVCSYQVAAMNLSAKRNNIGVIKSTVRKAVGEAFWASFLFVLLEIITIITLNMFFHRSVRFVPLVFVVEFVVLWNIICIGILHKKLD